MTPQQFVSENFGEKLSQLRPQFESIDWEGCYPEVTTDGVLTGNVVDAKSVVHVIVDCEGDGVNVIPGACDAMTHAIDVLGQIYECNICGDWDGDDVCDYAQSFFSCDDAVVLSNQITISGPMSEHAVSNERVADFVRWLSQVVALRF